MKRAPSTAWLHQVDERNSIDGSEAREGDGQNASGI